jgi:hypothetical protein
MLINGKNQGSHYINPLNIQNLLKPISTWYVNGSFFQSGSDVLHLEEYVATSW